MKMYLVYIDNGDSIRKYPVCAKSKQAARKMYQSIEGEIIKIDDVSEKYIIEESKIKDALTNAKIDGFSITFVIEALKSIGFIK